MMVNDTADAELTEIDADSAPAPGPAVVAVELDGETVVYDEESGALHLLDPIATVVWGCLDGKTTLAQTGADLATAFGAAPDAVAGDVVELVARLGRLGLLAGIAATEDLTEYIGATPPVGGDDDC